MANLKKLFFVVSLLAVCCVANALIWIDVRPPELHYRDPIDGDLNIQIDNIVSDVKAVLRYGGYKETPIVLYSQTGEVSAEAKLLLEAAGFINVSNAGSFEEAQKLRGLFIE